MNGRINIKPAVYKLEYKGVIHYKLGLYPLDARKRLALEKRCDLSEIKILDGGKKQ